MKGGGAYQSTIQQRYPDIHILPTATPEEALLAVVNGDAAAALDASQVMNPFLRRKYQNVLHVSGALSSLQIGRQSCRERVCQYVYISVVADSLQQKTIYK